MARYYKLRIKFYKDNYFIEDFETHVCSQVKILYKTLQNVFPPLTFVYIWIEHAG